MEPSVFGRIGQVCFLIDILLNYIYPTLHQVFFMNSSSAPVQFVRMAFGF